MSNKCELRPRRKMSREKIDAIFEELNKTTFKGILRIEYHKTTKDEPGWGDHTWNVSFVENGRNYGNRIFYLNGQREFHGVHGGGADFCYWITFVVMHTVGKAFNGMPMEDFDGKRNRANPDKYPTFEAYQNAKMLPNPEDPFQIRKRWYFQNDMPSVPPTHRFNTGPAIKHSGSYETNNYQLHMTDELFVCEDDFGVPINDKRT